MDEYESYRKLVLFNARLYIIGVFLFCVASCTLTLTVQKNNSGSSQTSTIENKVDSTNVTIHDLVNNK